MNPDPILEEVHRFPEAPMATGVVALRSATLDGQIRLGMRLPRRASGARMGPVLRLLGLGGYASFRRTPARRRTRADENQTSPHHQLPRSALVQP